MLISPSPTAASGERHCRRGNRYANEFFFFPPPTLLAAVAWHADRRLPSPPIPTGGSAEECTQAHSHSSTLKIRHQSTEREIKKDVASIMCHISLARSRCDVSASNFCEIVDSSRSFLSGSLPALPPLVGFVS